MLLPDARTPQQSDHIQPILPSPSKEFIIIIIIESIKTVVSLPHTKTLLAATSH